MSRALSYVIEVSGAPGACWLCEPSDEHDADELVTTSDPELASQWTDFVRARAALRAAVKTHPNRQFKLMTAPEDDEEPLLKEGRVRTWA